MRIEWDERKRRANLKKHGVDFRGAKRVFDGCTVTIADDRLEYEEERFVTFGLLDGQVVAVAHTEAEDLIRIISMRKATGNEEEHYFAKISGI